MRGVCLDWNAITGWDLVNILVGLGTLQNKSRKLIKGVDISAELTDHQETLSGH